MHSTMKREIKSMTLGERQEMSIREFLENLHQRVCQLGVRQEMTSESVSSDNRWLDRTDESVKLLIAQRWR